MTHANLFATYKSKQLHISNRMHVKYAADCIARGEIIISAFNGVFGIFGDADRKEVVNKILNAKDRPLDKGLVLVTPPELLHEHVDMQSAALSKYYSLENIVQLYHNVHAIGIILPAAISSAPSSLVKNQTILNIWTEYSQHQYIRQL